MTWGYSLVNRLKDIEIIPSNQSLGAEVCGIDLAEDIPGEVVHRIVKAWERHHVIYFRGQSIQDERQLEITQWFGPRHAPYPDMPILGDVSQPDIISISNVTEDGLLGGGRLEPHQDTIYLPTPLAGAVMRAEEVPKTGGDTAWSNLIQAYDELSPGMKRRLRGLKIIAFNPYAGRSARRDLGGEQQWFGTQDSAPHPHPLVRIHPPTGKKTLWVSCLNSERLVGLPDLEGGHQLLSELKTHVDQDHLYYTHRWKEGDVLVWDNRCCNHKREAIPEGQRRVFYRSVIGGCRPY